MLSIAPTPTRINPTLSTTLPVAVPLGAVQPARVDTFAVANTMHLPAAPLQRGQHGTAVKQLQAALMKLGLMSHAAYATGPGIFGPRTQAAVLHFQKAHHLTANGVFNGATRAAMANALSTPQKSTQASTAGRYDADHGTPMYNQHDPRWKNHRLGRNFTIGNAGCAMTATAMAISKISGRPINPSQLDHYLDTHHGYVLGDLINWDRAAAARNLDATAPAWHLSTIDKSLHLGKPVVIGVNFKPGGARDGTDHWITITARRKDSHGRTYYLAHDPGLGRHVWLYPHGSTLRSPAGTQHYNSTGRLIVFHRR